MQNNQYIQVNESQIVDPVVKLLEDIRTRKTKVTIPSSEDVIPSLWNDRTIRKSIFTEVNISDNSLGLEKPVRIPKIFQNHRSPEFPTAQQKLILNRLSKVPVYVVVTENQEMVMATPREDQEENFFDWLYTKYYNWFVWSEDNGPISIALFFLNKEDANLYLQEIGKKDPKCAEKTNLHIHLTSLDTFYKLNRTSSPGTQAKLIADLEEIYNVVFDYIPKKLHEVNPKQKYNKTTYQGNPVYILKPTVARKGSTKTLIDYKITDRSNNSYTRNVFFKLEDAYMAWDKFCESNHSAKLPLTPNIEIYNLESYLLDLENSDLETVKENYFVTPQTSFQDLKEELSIASNQTELSLTKKLEKFIAIKSKKLLQFYKGMLWVFTSDTLPTEDNAW